MAAKKTSELIPLCHPIAITHVGIKLDLIRSSSDVDDEGRSTDGGEVGQEGKERQSVPWQGTGQGDAYPFHTPVSPPSSANIKISAAQEGMDFGRVEITATVSCDGKTGVEMEALTAASTAALTVYDMCKAVDKGMRVEGLRVVRKEGGKSGLWLEGVQDDHNT